MAAKWKVGDHLLISKLISLCALDHSIEYQYISIGFTKTKIVTEEHFMGTAFKRIRKVLKFSSKPTSLEPEHNVYISVNCVFNFLMNNGLFILDLLYFNTRCLHFMSDLQSKAEGLMGNTKNRFFLGDAGCDHLNLLSV